MSAVSAVSCELQVLQAHHGVLPALLQESAYNKWKSRFHLFLWGVLCKFRSNCSKQKFARTRKIFHDRQVRGDRAGRGGTKEMMQSCLISLHLISLVAHRGREDDRDRNR